MKKIHLIYAACLLVGMGTCAASVQKQVKDNSDVWKEYNCLLYTSDAADE